MCHGHPQFHKCSHMSTRWLYCLEAIFDPDTGHEAPCSRPIYSEPEKSKAKCPLWHCQFTRLGGGNWTCCKCNHSANALGWCNGMRTDLTSVEDGYWAPEGVVKPRRWQTCGHGCCKQCSTNSEIPHPLHYKILSF